LERVSGSAKAGSEQDCFESKKRNDMKMFSTAVRVRLVGVVCMLLARSVAHADYHNGLVLNDGEFIIFRAEPLMAAARPAAASIT
jgi:hypothetical protein